MYGEGTMIQPPPVHAALAAVVCPKHGVGQQPAERRFRAAPLSFTVVPERPEPGPAIQHRWLLASWRTRPVLHPYQSGA